MPQTADMLGYNRAVTGLAPDGCIDHVAIENLAGVFRQKRADLVFLAGKRHRDAVDRHGHSREVDGQDIIDAQCGRFAHPRLASQLRLHACAEHLQRKRLGHIIIRPCSEPVYGVGILNARGQEHDGAQDRLAQAAADGEPVDIGKADIEQDDVGFAPGFLQSLDPGEGDGGKISLHFEIFLEHQGDFALIIDDEQQRLRMLPLFFHRLPFQAPAGCRHAVVSLYQLFINFFPLPKAMGQTDENR